jgi:hypothetical protein
MNKKNDNSHPTMIYPTISFLGTRIMIYIISEVYLSVSIQSKVINNSLENTQIHSSEHLPRFISVPGFGTDTSPEVWAREFVC